MPKAQTYIQATGGAKAGKAHIWSIGFVTTVNSREKAYFCKCEVIVHCPFRGFQRCLAAVILLLSSAFEGRALTSFSRTIFSSRTCLPLILES